MHYAHLRPALFLTALTAAFLVFAALSGAAASQSHENGIGPDPDGDTNPATITGVIARTGDAATLSDEAPYRVISFEPPPGAHGDAIINDYAEGFGVKFSHGATRQICEGQRRFHYDTMCTYEAAPSGSFAAGYLNHLNAPLVITFDEPVCVVTMAIYPTGGREGEPFTVTIEGWDDSGAALPPAQAAFEWTKYTVRWRHMAGAYYLGGRAKKVAVSMKSGTPSEAGDVLRYLFDDLAFVTEDCAGVLTELAEEDDAGVAPSKDSPSKIDADLNEELVGEDIIEDLPPGS